MEGAQVTEDKLLRALWGGLSHHYLPLATCTGGCSCAQCSWDLLVFPGRRLRITVILGAHNISDREQSQQRIRVGHWVIHPKYSRDGFKNDIMLLRVWPHPSCLSDLPLLTSQDP